MIGAGWLERAPAPLRALGRRRSSSIVEHVSLGTFCHTAAALRDAGLRRWSGPFDWIFSCPAMAAACLDDDFAALLDPAQLRSVPERELSHGAKRQCRHPDYEARYGLPIVFNHHDPASSLLDLQTLRRGVARFRAALQQGRVTIFYLGSERRWPEDEIEALERALTRYPAASRLVVLTITPEQTERSLAISPITDPGRLRYDVNVSTRTRSLGAAFPDPEDNAHLASALKTVASRLEGTLNGHI